MRTLYDGMSFEVIREAAAFNNGSFSTNWSTGQVTANNSSQERDGGRYRWIGDDTTTNDRYRYVGNGGETNLKPRYTGIQVTLYGRGELVAMNRTSSANGRGGTAYLGKDILGSVRSVTNESGQLEDRYEYDAFGKPYSGDLDNGMNLGYMGKPYDSNTGLYNYGYRDYKPEAARFTTVDPIRDGSNWFVYVNSDPVNYTDLWGLCSDALIGAKTTVGLETDGDKTKISIEQSSTVLGVKNDAKASLTIDEDIELNYIAQHTNPLFQLDIDVSIQIPNPFSNVGIPTIPEEDKDKIAQHSYEEGHGAWYDLDRPTVGGIRDRIDEVLADPDTQVGTRPRDDATGYLDTDGVILIHNPSDEDNKGSIFRPDRPQEYFDNNFPNQ